MRFHLWLPDAVLCNPHVGIPNEKCLPPDQPSAKPSKPTYSKLLGFAFFPRNRKENQVLLSNVGQKWAVEGHGFRSWFFVKWNEFVFFAVNCGKFSGSPKMSLANTAMNPKKLLVPRFSHVSCFLVRKNRRMNRLNFPWSFMLEIWTFQFEHQSLASHLPTHRCSARVLGLKAFQSEF